MDLNKIKPEISKAVTEVGYQLFELNWFDKKNDSILQVVIDHDDGILLDDCVKVNERLSQLLDTIISEDEQYYLEVCSPGLERKIRNEEEVLKCVGSYVFMKVDDDVERFEVEGQLLSYEDGVLDIMYKQKTRTQTKKIKYSDVKFMRHAVKF